MTKYVIDLPDGTTAVVAKKPYFLNETDVMRIPVSQLEMYVEPSAAENATVEKRVIELPVELFNYLLKIKKTHRGGISHFMSDAIKKRPIIQDLDTEDVLKDEMLVDWYLHPELVEFVPKKEQQYAVETKFGYVMAIYSGPGKKLGVSEFTYDDYTQNFTENEADEIIACLGGENGLLKPRKVKVEE